MNWTQHEIDNTLNALIERTMKDDSFRQLALRDARAAIDKISPRPMPANFSVKFVDNAGADMTVVLPDAAAVAGQELKDEELAGVAGGTIGVVTTACVNFTNACLGTNNNLTFCNPGLTKKPGSPAFCPR